MAEYRERVGEHGDQGPAGKVRTAALDEVAKKGARIFKWENPKLSRSARVIAFLEELPITKGILRGKQMRLLPRQREFIERLYATPRGERRPFNLAVKSEPKGNGQWRRAFSSSGSGCPFVSGANGKTNKPSKNTAHIAIPP